MWDIAGSGHIDEGETAKFAVIRECKEEIDIDINIDDLSFIHLSHRFSLDRVYYDIYFLVTNYSGEPCIMEPEKCSDLEWFIMDNLPDDMIPCRKKAIEYYKDKIFYSEIIEQ